MEQKLCFGCMRSKFQTPICEHCGHDERMQNEPHQLPAGTLLKGQYIVGKVLGQGGFGVTYLGYDQYLRQIVAIKEYYPTGLVMRDSAHSLAVTNVEGQMGTTFQSNLRRFLREAQSLAKLSEVPEVVQVRNFFPENGTAYIIMEFVQGTTLKDYLRSQGLLSPAQAMAVFQPVMEGLQKVHEVGLVHRDISPDNIMLLPGGGVKILDFGAVRDYTNQELSQSTQAILKPGFAPVEQYRAMSELGPWTDLYALCATMYYCMSGKLPPEAPERMMEGARFQWERIQGLTDVQLAALQKGTKILAKDRYQTVAEFRDALLGRVPVQTETRETGRKSGAKWIAMAAAVAVVAAIGAGVMLMPMGQQEEIPEAPVSMQIPTTEAAEAAERVDDPLVMESQMPPHSVMSHETAVGSENYFFWKEETEDCVRYFGPGLDITIHGKTITGTISALKNQEEYTVDRSETEKLSTELEWELTLESMFESYRLETSYYAKNPGANRKLKPAEMNHGAYFSPDGSSYNYLAKIHTQDVAFTEDTITWTLTVPEQVPMSTLSTQMNAGSFTHFYMHITDTETGMNYGRFYYPAPEGTEPGEFPVVEGQVANEENVYGTHTEHTYSLTQEENKTIVQGDCLKLTQQDQRDLTIELEDMFMAGAYSVNQHETTAGKEEVYWEVVFRQGDRRFRVFIRYIGDGSESMTLTPVSEFECGYTVMENDAVLAQGEAFFESDGQNLTLYARLPWALAKELDLYQVEYCTVNTVQNYFNVYITRYYTAQ